MTITTLMFLAATAAAAADCKIEYERRLAADLALDYQAFDQTHGQGFRILAGMGCPGEAADLIERYIAHTGAPQSSLTWHLAQMRAESGDYPRAIAAARKSLRDPDPAKPSPFRWNDYVLAVTAFLEHDRVRFVVHRAVLAEHAEAHYGNAMNLKFLDRLLVNFDGTYLEAVLGPEPTPEAVAAALGVES